jgi:alditol oxidase
MTTQHKNWAGNYEYQAARVHHPETLEQVQDLVRQNEKVKALGSRHSFNSIADTHHDHISMRQLDKVVSLNREQRTVTVEGGMRYGELGEYLNSEGFALHNMASLPHISVVGACATATHGSGVGNGNLATVVSGLEIVTADGEIKTLSRQDADFAGAVVGLGGIGIITKMTLNIVPRFQMRQDVYLNLPMTEANFEDVISAAYSVSLFTKWQTPAFEQVWLKSRVDDNNAFWDQGSFYGAVRATTNVPPIEEVPVERCTEQMGIHGFWNERLPHFRMNFTPSFGEELQSEYFVPRQNAFQALERIHALAPQIGPHLFISEIRTIAADDLWMSPCYGQSCVGIHFTWKQNWGVVQTLLPLIENQLQPLQVRPHWGKLFTLSPGYVASCYEKLPEFQKLLSQYDPAGKFRNAFLDRYIFASMPQA